MANTTATPHPRSLLIFGTAWKEDRTAELIREVLLVSFRAVDTANYPTGYNEPLTGDDLFIQTKFTPLPGVDEQSFKHLKVDYLDALSLHTPLKDEDDNMKAWKVFETYVPDRVRRLGVSNFSLAQLVKVYEAATIKPEMVQNCFYKETCFDPGVRAFCQDKGSDLIGSVSEKLDVEKELTFYLLILGLGGTQVLCGTTKPDRIRRNLEAVANWKANQAVRDELQPSVEAFKQMLEELIQEGGGSKM
ncbi:NADP-dependent oxidoreductase domain-containing protein [Lasiosphaeris hirsuta]|uniref:NADP-dependent oxidoreductase domain-containing protein n=1 Tax=Lasiosphaeris hirsuta TaxID=260670 RepID=A0AA40B042_9PEZI|nr:NADP-dependent oxidoreductase domain-containing protein [Lasiosphaeris hirsuta]